MRRMKTNEVYAAEEGSDTTAAELGGHMQFPAAAGMCIS